MRSYVISLALVLAACEKQTPAPEKPQTAALQPVTSPAPGSDPHALNPHAPSADPHAGLVQPTAPVPTEPAKAGGLTWSAPDAFIRRAPKSSMRVAEYGLKGTPQAELGVFYFGADQGGTVEANMTRWVGQFTQADGSATKPKRSEREIQGVKVSLVEASGMFGGGMAMPAAPIPTAKPDAKLLGAIAKGPEGSVFFKLTGPKAALEEARGAFNALIDSIAVSK
ncbi:MAG: hypothetical protein JWN48_3900 [Myxococcaceae bacterium]|nr:hypothetical protein [Myxococcaceae bacterium]